MGRRGNRRRTRATVLAFANGLLALTCVGVGVAIFFSDVWVLRAAAVAAVVTAVGASLLVRHQLLVERVAHSDDRAHVAQEYSRLTNVRVVENAEFVDLMHRRLDQIDERLDKIDQEVAAVVAAGDKHSDADAPTVVDLRLRGLAAS